MKRKPISGIYAIKNEQEGACYVGSSVDVHSRLSIHKSHLMRLKHHSKLLQEDWNRLGQDAFSFEIIEEVDLVSMQERENFWMSVLKGLERYNSCKAGARRDMRFYNLYSAITDVGTIYVGQAVIMDNKEWEVSKIYKMRGISSAVMSRGDRTHTVYGLHYRTPFTPMETQ